MAAFRGFEEHFEFSRGEELEIEKGQKGMLRWAVRPQNLCRGGAPTRPWIHR